jgi:hypothetical protein
MWLTKSARSTDRDVIAKFFFLFLIAKAPAVCSHDVKHTAQIEGLQFKDFMNPFYPLK